jgi:hypothetical protein
LVKDWAMNTFLIRRLIQAIPTLFGISVLSFLLMLATPGDPITTITFNPSSKPEATAMLRRQLGLDQPALVQYAYWLIGNDWRQIDLGGVRPELFGLGCAPAHTVMGQHAGGVAQVPDNGYTSHHLARHYDCHHCVVFLPCW